MRFSKDQRQLLRCDFSDSPPLTISSIPVLWPPGASAIVTGKPVLYQDHGAEGPDELHSQTQTLITLRAVRLSTDKVVNSGLTFLTLVSIMWNRKIRKEIAGGGIVPKEEGLQTDSLARGH